MVSCASQFCKASYILPLVGEDAWVWSSIVERNLARVSILDVHRLTARRRDPLRTLWQAPVAESQHIVNTPSVQTHRNVHSPFRHTEDHPCRHTSWARRAIEPAAAAVVRWAFGVAFVCP
jgi:hypothetical protein